MKLLVFKLRSLIARKKDLVWYLTFAVFILLIFGQSFSFSFLSWDDVFHICKNPHYKSSDGSFLNFWKSDFLGLYAPVTYTIWAATVGLAKLIFGESSNCGEWSGLFHGLNLLIHFINTILVFEVLNLLVKPKHKKHAAFGALLFAIHPLQVETVAWVSGGRDLLSFLFGICGVLFALKDHWKRATVFLLVSCMAKATGVVFPLVVFTILIQKRQLYKTVKYVPVLLGAVGFGIFAKSLQPDSALNFISPLWQRPFIFSHNLGFYFYKLILPIELAPDYTRSIKSLHADPSLFWPSVIFISIVILVYFLRSARGLLAFALIIISLLPTSGLVPFGYEEISTVADRYFYTAMFGVAFLTTNILNTYNRKICENMTVLILAALMVLSLRQVGHWKDDETLFRYNLSIYPASSVARQNLADVYIEKKDYQAAIKEIENYLKYRPPNYLIVVKLGFSLENLGRINEAEQVYKSAIEQNIESSELYNNLGRIYMQKGEPQAAEISWTKAVNKSSTNFEPQFNLGVLYFYQGRYKASLEAFTKAKKIFPYHPNIDEKIKEAKSKIQ